MGFSLNNAAAAMATGVADVATTYAKTEIGSQAAMKLEDHRAQIQAERDARQNEFTKGENVANREHATNLQDRGFTHATNLQTSSQTHQTEMQKTSIEAAAEQGRLNRQLQAAGQSIQARQVAVLEKGAELDREVKQIQLKNARDVETLREAYKDAKTPEEKAKISENISILTGKDADKFLPVPLKDEMGNITGYQIFDTKRGTFVDQKPGAAQSKGAQWDDKSGAVIVDGKTIGTAKTEAEARKMLANHRKPAAAPATAPGAAPAKGILNSNPGYGAALDALPGREYPQTENNPNDYMAIP